ncbi:MAG TPA: DUF1080 domain-containing protein [Terriglobia bacterium]|nr:DUF1080 domain-containing protein [Terriglobia bacterium]
MNLLLSVIVLAATLPQIGATTARIVTPQTGVYAALFDGKSLQGWTAKNTTPTTFSVRDGFIRIEGNSGWLQSEREFADFRLRVEVRFLTDNADSGVFVRAVGDSIFLRGWPGNSYQIQARDVTRNQSANPILIGNIYRHGNRGGETTFDSAAALRVAKPISEWQTFEIEVVGETLNVTLNGTVITRANGLANRRGYIGLQGEAGIVEYRAIQIQELP